MLVTNTSATSDTQRLQESRVTTPAVNDTTQQAQTDNKAANATADKGTQHQVLSRWVALATVTKSMGNNEQSVRTLKQLSFQLKALSARINQQTINGNANQQQIASAVSQMKAQLQQGGVNGKLRSNDPSQASVTRELTNKVDLLTPKALDEQVSIVMGRTGKAVSFSLPAYADKSANLATLQQAFAGQEISVTVSDRDSLLFTTAKAASSALKEPWLMMGKGVRIAAGNPVSVSLSEEPHALDSLQQLAQSQNTSSEAYQQQIAQLQKSIRSSLQNIESQRQQILQRLQQIQRSPVGAEELQELTEQVQQILNQPDQNAVSILVSQANITRNLVSFSLSSSR
ncbi:hypothetical protein PY479_15780 [Shewanella sp. A32]|uniref:hypothetical protein n=1 Tax=Shewanella sp. A32 TaxID=3031327 RepID=UPI0023B9B163|nr:hypothetical protein [Shewanella sp. A32]MDF0535732.1 hypothetical protein [Shewanella sp. A32]